MFAAMAAMLPFVSAFGSSAPAHGDGKMVWGLMMGILGSDPKKIKNITALLCGL